MHCRKKTNASWRTVGTLPAFWESPAELSIPCARLDFPICCWEAAPRGLILPRFWRGVGENAEFNGSARGKAVPLESLPLDPAPRGTARPRPGIGWPNSSPALRIHPPGSSPETIRMRGGAMNIRRQVAESILGEIEWRDEFRGFCRCPGIDLHTGKNAKRDCQISVDGAPSVYCVHASCADAVAASNRTLRSQIGIAERNGNTVLPARRHTKEELERREREKVARGIKERAMRSREKIFGEFATEPSELFRRSPTSLDNVPAGDLWRHLLGVFPIPDVVWIGDIRDSGNKSHAKHFRPVRDWLKCPECPGPFVVPSSFKPGSISRSKDSVACRRFYVVESDTLAKPEQCAVIGYAMQFSRLRAIVFSGNRSFHAWLEIPAPDVFAKLELILPGLGTDPAGFKPAQPFRMPGVKREDRESWTDLVYLDAEGSP